LLLLLFLLISATMYIGE